MFKLTQEELLNSAFKEALHREEQWEARYRHLAGIAGDRRLKKILDEFAGYSAGRLATLKDEMKKLGI